MVSRTRCHMEKSDNRLWKAVGLIVIGILLFADRPRSHSFQTGDGYRIFFVWLITFAITSNVLRRLLKFQGDPAIVIGIATMLACLIGFVLWEHFLLS